MGKKVIPGGLAIDRLVHRSELPPNPVMGEVGFNKDRNVLVWWDGSNPEYPTFVDNQDVATDTKTVSNTTTETELTRIDIDDSALVKGRVMVFRMFGKYSTASSNDSATVRVYIGDKGFDPTVGEGSKIAQVQTTQQNVTDGPFLLKSTFTVNAEGVSGEIQPFTEARFNNDPADDSNQLVTVNTTTGESIVATVEWSAAKTGNTMRRQQHYVQQQA